MTDEGPGVEYPGNSKKKKEKTESENAVEKVISGEVVMRKKPLGRKIAETFNGEDTRSVGHYVLFEIIIPEFKRILSDVISQGTDRLLFGETRSSSRPSGRERVPYNRYHESSRREERRDHRSRSKSTDDYRDVIVRDRGEAERVKDGLLEYLDLYGQVPMTVFWDLLGVSGSFNDENWGWYDLRGIRVIPARGGGYMFDLPRPEPIENR